MGAVVARHLDKPRDYEAEAARLRDQIRRVSSEIAAINAELGELAKTKEGKVATDVNAAIVASAKLGDTVKQEAKNIVTTLALGAPVGGMWGTIKATLSLANDAISFLQGVKSASTAEDPVDAKLGGAGAANALAGNASSKYGKVADPVSIGISVATIGNAVRMDTQATEKAISACKDIGLAAADEFASTRVNLHDSLQERFSKAGDSPDPSDSSKEIQAFVDHVTAYRSAQRKFLLATKAALGPTARMIDDLRQAKSEKAEVLKDLNWKLSVIEKGIIGATISSLLS